LKSHNPTLTVIFKDTHIDPKFWEKAAKLPSGPSEIDWPETGLNADLKVIEQRVKAFRLLAVSVGWIAEGANMVRFDPIPSREGWWEVEFIVDDIKHLGGKLRLPDTDTKPKVKNRLTVNYGGRVTILFHKVSKIATVKDEETTVWTDDGTHITLKLTAHTDFQKYYYEWLDAQ